jgi:hypothetical protein
MNASPAHTDKEIEVERNDNERYEEEGERYLQGGSVVLGGGMVDVGGASGICND